MSAFRVTILSEIMGPDRFSAASEPVRLKTISDARRRAEPDRSMKGFGDCLVAHQIKGAIKGLDDDFRQLFTSHFRQREPGREILLVDEVIYLIRHIIVPLPAGYIPATL